MPQQVLTSVENNFTKGLITEATGLNFPENAATETDNCNYTLIGDVVRRLGIDLETNGNIQQVDSTNQALSSYVWKNVGGDGDTAVMVKQVGANLYFFYINQATNTNPLSKQQSA